MENLAQPKNLASKLLITGIAVILAAVIFLTYRNRQMDRLYAEATGDPRYIRSSDDSEQAVEKLANYRDKRSTDLLLQLAMHGGFPGTKVQVKAIRTLGASNDPAVAGQLAYLLQPHEGLDNRQAAADALQSLPCKGECNRSILHYLQRISAGEPNYEDRTVFPSMFQDITVNLRKDQQELYSKLYAVLNREKLETLTNLVTIYGLGSVAPSRFGIDLVTRAKMQEACPLLLKSQEAIQTQSIDTYKAPRTELSAAIASLNCK